MKYAKQAVIASAIGMTAYCLAYVAVGEIVWIIPGVLVAMAAFASISQYRREYHSKDRDK